MWFPGLVVFFFFFFFFLNYLRREKKALAYFGPIFHPSLVNLNSA